MLRREVLKWMTGSAAYALVAVAKACLYPQSASAVDTADLKSQLETGLYAYLPAHFEFIAKVVALVEQDRLPLKLVYSTFKWAREKDKGRRFYYFEAALRRRAEKIGVNL